MDNNIVDFKSWTIPTSWDEVKLSVFQKLEKEKANEDMQIIDILHILADKTKDEVMELPSEFIDIMLSKLQFLTTPMPQQEPSYKIEIDGETYQINFMEKLKTGEYISFNNVIKAEPYNYAAMLAILCRKEGEVYDSKFEAEVFNDRVKLFENQPITKIMPLINFFFLLSATLRTPSQLSMLLEEELNRTLKDIDDSPNLGRWKKRSLKRQVKTLLKRLK
jgi:hypothetical protein